MEKVLDAGAGDNRRAVEADDAPTLDAVAREGARRMLETALEAEVARYIEAHEELRGADGRRLVVRNGRAQARRVTCGAGTMEVRAPRVNDRRVDDEGERQRFTSRILPPYMRRSPKVAEALPLLYLHGLSTGDFREALPVLLGDEAAGLSATNIARLTASWDEEYQAFRKRDLSACDYVYVWVDGIHFNIRLEDDRLCTLVMIGVRANGTKSWWRSRRATGRARRAGRACCGTCSAGGMQAPAVAVGDGALGSSWRTCSTSRRNDCGPRAKRALHDVMYAPTKTDAETAIGSVRGRVRGEVPEGDGLLGGGPGGVADVLLLSRRALDAPADDEPDRVAVRDGQAPAASDEGCGLPDEGPADGLQAAGDGFHDASPASRSRSTPDAAASACRSSDPRLGVCAAETEMRQF